MSKTTELSDQTNPELELDEEDLDASDYGFIFSADGELKHMFAPDEFELDPPKVIKKILKLLGIDDINNIPFDQDQTLH
jgi:hypothetical protein